MKKKLFTIFAFLLVGALVSIATQYFTYKYNITKELNFVYYELQREQDAALSLKIEKVNLEKENLALTNSLNELAKQKQELEKELASRGSSLIISDKEFYLFTCIVAREADTFVKYSDNYEAALDVATVIMNRLPYWGGTITSVVSAHTHNKDGTTTWQFATYPNYTWCTPQPWDIQACKDALAGKRTLDKNVLFFCSVKSYYYGRYSEWWHTKVFVLERHGHVFTRNP